MIEAWKAKPIKERVGDLERIRGYKMTISGDVEFMSRIEQMCIAEYARQAKEKADYAGRN